jgi:DNA-binding CsgD family transcriptional regulator
MAASGRFTPRQALVLEQLLMGRSQRECARNTGIPERTVRRYVADPGFQRRLQEAVEESVKEVRRGITMQAKAAAQVLVRIAGNHEGAAGHPDANRQIYAASRLLQAFTALQPKEVRQDVELHQVPVIDYVIEGVDPELLA